MGRVKHVETSLRCKECGNKATIRRKKSLQKQGGHVKHMYCPWCQETTEHVEAKDDY